MIRREHETIEGRVRTACAVYSPSNFFIDTSGNPDRDLCSIPRMYNRLYLDTSTCSAPPVFSGSPSAAL